MIQAVKTELCQYLLIKEVWTDGTRLQKGLFFSFFDIGEIFQGFPEQLRVRTTPLPDKWNPLARFQIKCLVDQGIYLNPVLRHVVSVRLSIRACLRGRRIAQSTAECAA